MLLASSRRRDGAGGGRGGEMRPVLVWVRSGENFSLGEQGTRWGASSGFFVTWLKGEPYKGCPAL